MSFQPDISTLISDARKPYKECPECGEKPITKVSFKGKTYHRAKRKTQTCSCGWSNIIPTEREAMIELGFLDEETL
jgi:hypothetical protein